MALKFGTSGVRGLVSEMTDRECYLYVAAYARHLQSLTAVRRCAIAGDLRSSTPRVLLATAAALEDEGFAVEHCGFVPTPALVDHAMASGQGSVMVTGSHIPDDRNGIKFNLPTGEISKADEQAITALHEKLATEDSSRSFTDDGMFAEATALLGEPNAAVAQRYVQRFVQGFPDGCLNGRKLVVYEHSAVGRDLLGQILTALGAQVIPVGRSDQFVPVDTEAVAEPERLRAWVNEHNADALLSLDGDSDRPLLVDDSGKVMRGDVLGIFVAQLLAADWVATPVSCNTALELCGAIPEVRRTRIGSPYVIAGMAEGQAAGKQRIVGYEANGGFLTATDVSVPGGAELSALPTRDAVLPMLAVLYLAAKDARAVSALRTDLPPRYTVSGLLRPFASAHGQALVRRIRDEGEAFVRTHLAAFGEVANLDFTDGARMSFAGGDVIHLRPSGNAPEFRCYTEADSEERAQNLNDDMLRCVDQSLRQLVE